MGTPGHRLAIDFGTSSTVAVLAGPDGRARPLLFDGSPLLASNVFAGPSGGELLTGADAERAALGYPAGLEVNPKRRIDDRVLWLGDREYDVVDVVSAVLGRVAAEARRVAGAPPASTVLTHPASWGRTRLDVLAAAAERAGLRGCTYVAEPVAAAAYFADVLGRDLPVGRHLLVYDLGAGTCDVSVVRRTATGLDVVASSGLDDVGGLDLDAVVVAHARSLTDDVVDAWGRLDWPRGAADHQARHLLWRGARAVKEHLSRHATADLHIPLVDRTVHLTREEFEHAARPHLTRTADLAVTVLRDARVAPTTLAGVFLVGGSSRVPLAAALLHRALRIAPTALDHPEIVVAEGALHAEPAPAREPAARPPTEPATHPPTEPAPAPGPAAPISAAAGRPAAQLRPRLVGVVVSVTVVLAVLVVLAAIMVPRMWPSDTDVLTGHTDYIYDMAFSPDGTRLATGGADETVRVWDMRDDDHPSTVLRHPFLVNAVAFAPDGTLATGSDDDVVRLWDVRNGDLVGKIDTGHSQGIDDVAFSPDGRMLATAGQDGTVQVWDVSDPVRSRYTIDHPTQVYEVEFSPDGTRLATLAADSVVRLWDLVELAEAERGRQEAEEDGVEWSGGEVDPVRLDHASDVYSIAFAPNGEVLATIGEDGIARLWRVATGAPLEDASVSHGSSAGALAFSPDGTRLATGGEDNMVTLWNVAPPDYRADQAGTTLVGHSSTVYAVAFSPDGTRLASAGQDHDIRLWDLTAARNS